MSVYDIVEGTSNVLQFQLIENGTAIPLTNVTVTLLLEDRTGTPLVSPGTVAIIDATNGKVQFTPTSTATFVAANGPYYARWQLTDGSNLIGYVPASNRDIWAIAGL